MNDVLNTDIAWLAGIIDGEACISIARVGAQEAYRPMLCIDNTSSNMLVKAETIMNNLGGVSKYQSVRPSNRGPLSKLPLYRLYIRNVSVVLSAVIPYMATTKRDFAQEIVDLFSTRVKYAHWTEEQRVIARKIRADYMPRMRPTLN